MEIKDTYIANALRYAASTSMYRRCGRSGILLPKVSLGFWHNFGATDPAERSRDIMRCAFDNGITHFDLANNYGNPYNGAAEENFGKILKRGLGEYRHELCISTKAGYDMWDGPYGAKHGSRKYLLTSLEPIMYLPAIITSAPFSIASSTLSGVIPPATAIKPPPRISLIFLMLPHSVISLTSSPFSAL